MSKHIKTTTCTMDCPDACALEVTVADGKIEKIAGARDGHPTTGGFICSKVSRFAERVYHEDRLLYPMKRSGPRGSGKFSRIGTLSGSPYTVAEELNTIFFTPYFCMISHRLIVPATLFL